MKAARRHYLLPVLFFASPLFADHVILDDCIIDGSMAIGLDAVNGENFGFDTLRLKENNLRFHFDDTSLSASFPRNDWRLIANDSANGGDSYLAIEDVTGGRIPFRTVAGAPSHSLYVDSQGDVGLGTNNPVLEMHIADGDTPSVRLEQSGASGWNPQTWDMAGNETNFFIRDVTNGSKLPFRIRPNAPTSSLDIEADGNVKIAKSVSIGSTVAELRLVIPEGGPTSSPGIQVGNAFISGENDTILRAAISNNNWHTGAGWSENSKDARGGVFHISDDRFLWHKSSAGVGVPTFSLLMELDSSGNLDAMGTVTGSSDRNKKRDIVSVDASAMLEKVLELPISEWSYKDDQTEARHVGPMAQDFRATFGLGKDDKTISFHDPAGVALAAIQGLGEMVTEKEKRIEELEAKNEELEERLERIEQMMRGSLD